MNITIRFTFVTDSDQSLHTIAFETWSEFEDWKGQMGKQIKIISDKIRCFNCD